ncbi:MAG TPA: RNA polymerase sigma factor RpoD/SigA [Treponemataceae bacterium]|jgi:RNA polymerase primary sigma factor|nr:RNA polymerase sigma factor RpoD/SigA [Treponemataceae bacterium]HUH45424.1 RNA polymerase sigma factor RpoD/SigA [Treponemataceae bacterium]
MQSRKSISFNKDENIVSLYLKDINRIPLLSREEETSLALRAADGDKEAKDKIVSANLRFVVSIAKKYQNNGLDLLDLVNEGNIGLLTAIERFDVSKGYHFISYAVWWIRQAILKAISEKTKMIRLPLNRVNELMQIEKARKELSGGKSEEEELREVAEMVYMKPEQVKELLAISRDLLSLDSTIRFDSSDSTTIGDIVEDGRYESPEEVAVYENMKDEIDEVMQTLTERERDVLAYRFGLNGKPSMSLKEVGDVFNLTKERIRQIEKKAIKRLQHPSRSARLESFVA